MAVNVADRATPPPQRSARATERNVWTPEELGAFLRALDGHQQRPILHTMAMTGLRRSEACALRWTNVDLVGQVLEVVAGLTQTAGALHLDEPKSVRGRRIIDLDEETSPSCGPPPGPACRAPPRWRRLPRRRLRLRQTGRGTVEARLDRPGVPPDRRTASPAPASLSTTCATRTPR